MWYHNDVLTKFDFNFMVIVSRSHSYISRYWNHQSSTEQSTNNIRHTPLSKVFSLQCRFDPPASLSEMDHDWTPSQSHRQNTQHTTNTTNTTNTSTTSGRDLPRSVRNAPRELRAAIRRRQNKESARRCRERQLNKAKEMEERFQANEQRIQGLERRIDELTDVLQTFITNISTQQNRQPNIPPSQFNSANNPTEFQPPDPPFDINESFP